MSLDCSSAPYSHHSWWFWRTRACHGGPRAQLTVGSNSEVTQCCGVSVTHRTPWRGPVVPTHPLHGPTDAVSLDLSIRFPHSLTPEDKAIHLQHRAIY